MACYGPLSLHSVPFARDHRQGTGLTVIEVQYREIVTWNIHIFIRLWDTNDYVNESLGSVHTLWGRWRLDRIRPPPKNSSPALLDVIWG